jgi:hypothetical protein
VATELASVPEGRTQALPGVGSKGGMVWDGQPGQPNKYGKAIRSLIMCNMIVIWFKPNKYLQLGIVLGKQMNGLSCWLYHIN